MKYHYKNDTPRYCYKIIKRLNGITYFLARVGYLKLVKTNTLNNFSRLFLDCIVAYSINFFCSAFSPCHFKCRAGATYAQDNYRYRAIFNCHAVFPIETNNELADHIKAVADQFHGIWAWRIK